MSPAGWKETRILAGFALVGLLVVALLTTLGGCASRSGGSGDSPVARAAYVSSSGGGYKFGFGITVAGVGHKFALSGSGSIDASGRGTMQIGEAGGTIAAVLAYPNVYIRTSNLPSARALARTPWIEASMPIFDESTGVGNLLGTDPARLIDYLKAAAQVTTVGRGNIDGVPTTHYRAVVDLARYPDVVPAKLRSAATQASTLLEQITGKSALPVDAWIDRTDRVRRVQVRMSVCLPHGRLGEAFGLDIYGYGNQPPVTVPNASQVTDLTAELSSVESQVLGQLRCK